MSRFHKLISLLCLTGTIFCFILLSNHSFPTPKSPNNQQKPTPTLSSLDDPIQKTITPFQIHTNNATLTAKATFKITAKILSITNYESEELGDTAPYDLALGWGLISDNTYTNQITITQSNRFYFWSHYSDIGLNADYITSHSANTHIIPANPKILSQLHQLHSDQIIHLAGFLVDIDHKNGTNKPTSLTRTDSGAGACEIIYVKTLKIL
jgi:hypothetical protein